MTKARSTLIVFIALGAGALAQPRGIERVAWLQGCWETSTGERTIEEHWMAPRGTNMVGMSRTVRGNTLVSHEFLLLREAGDRLEYESHPSGQRSATFLSTMVSDEMVIFDNPQHDFPQRIGYRREGSSSLVAWIEGTNKGQARRIEFPYRRVPCSGG